MPSWYKKKFQNTTTDANGAEVLYKYDYIGRITEVLAPKEAEAVRPYTLKFEYGTLFREYKSVMPYKFSGKELDQETGYYYYGALYYDHSTALWLGVDPLAEKYPDVSPYVYCAGNLVCRVDYNGNGIKGYGTAKAIAEYGISCAEMYSGVSFCTGVVDGFIRVLTDMPADTPYFIENPMFSFGSNAVNVGYNIYI